MPQTSLSTWLKKPQAVLEPPPNPTSSSTQPVPALSPQPARRPDDGQQPAAKAPQARPGLSRKAPPALPANVELVPASPDRITSFRRLNALLLPIPYPQAFYDEILTDPVTNDITLLAIWHPQPPADSFSAPSSPSPKSPSVTNPVVAGIRCRILPHPSPQQPQGSEQKPSSHSHPPTLYISTLVQLSPYRGHGIATHLLRTVLSRAITRYHVASVTAHVWEANPEGREWYRKRGFEELGCEEGYYRRLKPQTAVLVRRWVGVDDVLDHEP